MFEALKKEYDDALPKPPTRHQLARMEMERRERWAREDAFLADVDACDPYFESTDGTTGVKLSCHPDGRVLVEIYFDGAWRGRYFHEENT